ncbi:MAG: hypothetical protein ACOH1Q_09255 [Thiobacillus sp.]
MGFYEERFAGYLDNPVQVVFHTVPAVAGFDEMFIMADFRVERYCDHHSNKQ